MENWIQEALIKWRLEGVKLNPPASIIEIENVESILSFKFPQDFKDFYVQANGFKGLDCEKHMFTLWPLDLIISEFKDNTNKNFIGFCDYLIVSHLIGFNRNKPGVFKMYYNNDGELIAQAFEEVVGMINSDDHLIY